MRKSDGAVATYLMQQRTQRGLGKQTLAKLAKVNRSTIIAMEKSLATPRFDIVYCMLRAMDLTVADLEAWLKEHDLDLAA